jgi:hypothetical protein
VRPEELPDFVKKRSRGKLSQRSVCAGRFSQPSCRLASSVWGAHNSSMPQNHPFTIRIETESGAESRRYHWSIFEGAKLRGNSAHSYATRREATAEAERRALQLSTNLQNKPQSKAP